MKLNQLTGVEGPFFPNRHRGVEARVRPFGSNTSRLGVAYF